MEKDKRKKQNNESLSTIIKKKSQTFKEEKIDIVRKTENKKPHDESLLTIMKSFEDKIDIMRNDFDCLITLANKLINKVNDEQTNNENMVKFFKKYETIESDIIKLNVGGTLFSTLKSTLTKQIKNKDGELYPPNMLESIVNGFVKPKYDENKVIFIDRNPKYFGCILDYLRMANTDCEYQLVPSIDKNELLKEAKFYNILGLIDLIDSKKWKLDSVILSDEKSAQNLMKICEFPSNTNLNLLFRASRDGFFANNFHSKCDYIPKTLTIIKTTGNYIFGGYTEQSWDGSGHKCDPNAFLFSINYNEKAKIKPNMNYYAIYCEPYNGPCFGSSDIAIQNNFASNQNSTNRSSYIFQKTNNISGSSGYFLATEIEVFSLN